MKDGYVLLCPNAHRDHGLASTLAIGEALRERRDLLCRSNAGKRGGRDRIHADAVEYRREGPVELQVELAVAGVFGEHASTVSPLSVRRAAQ